MKALGNKPIECYPGAQPPSHILSSYVPPTFQLLLPLFLPRVGKSESSQVKSLESKCCKFIETAQ